MSQKSSVIKTPQYVPRALTLDSPGDADFDLYVRKGAEPTTSEWDWRAFSVSADERILVPADSDESYYIMVHSFERAGNYTLRVEAA